jgi:hypothetical protein
VRSPTHPSLYQINTRVVLNEIGRALARPATLDDLPDEALDEIASLGFDWVWFLGVWQTGTAARDVSRRNAEWRREYESLLSDLTDDDISGSPYAIREYAANLDFGGDAALLRLRRRLEYRGLRLLLDFVPNHVALDHAWVDEHPEYFVHGDEERLAREPQNWVRVGSRILAYGRDPYFSGWPDTLQLNYRHPGLRAAMRAELLSIAELADGVRCDMAMLLLPDVFLRTWGDTSAPADGREPDDAPFWPEAIAGVRQRHPDFLFMAEVYWDLEYVLQQQGFDYTYDKRLYDRLREGDARAVREHLWADPEFQRRSARFLENHDEPRAAAVFPRGQHEAAAVVTYFVQGLRFFHEGQLDCRQLHVSIHLCRRPDEPVDEELHAFYRRLLEALRRPEVRDGEWRLLECRPAWEENATWDRFITFAWEDENGRRLLATVNYGPDPGQCYVALPFGDLGGRSWRLRDLLGEARYDREGDDLATQGLYLDLPPWGYHLFSLTEIHGDESDEPDL